MRGMDARTHIEAKGLVKTFRSPEGPVEAVRDLDLVYRRDSGRL
jgi:hypothetical protein